MTREEAGRKAKIMLEYANGKEIEFYDEECNGWSVVNDPLFNASHKYYRVKPESEYRPFRFTKECFDEMRKHEPFGWVHDDYKYSQVVGVFKDKIEFTPFERNDEDGLESFIMTFSEVLNKGYKFVDGKPFGIKVN